MRDLSQKEIKFIDAYLETGHITNAAIAAGYSKDNANSAGNRLMKRDRVQKQLKALREQISQKYIYSRERMIAELEDVIAQASEGDYPNFAAVLKAKEMICKIQGLYDDNKVEVNISNSFAAVAAGTPQGGTETDG